MALNVIGAGFGITGTESMKRALNRLSLGPCHYMFEIKIGSPEQKHWHCLLSGAAPDWDATYAGYGATVDWPGACFWRELAEHYPQAKVVLTVRDPKALYLSMDQTILKLLRSISPDDTTSIAWLIGQRELGGDYNDRDRMIEAFERHNAAVQAAFGPDWLLTYQLGAGWEPLCEFLGCDVPDDPYPMGNNSESMQAHLGKIIAHYNRS